MRPVRLTLCGFCSYAHEEVIPFDQLGTEGVYLISGDTGSGKTTLFDGITYALYGQSSGKTRDASMLRCRSMPEDQRPYVRLDFQHNGRLYNVERSLPYHPPRRKTEIPADAQACRDGELIADGLKKVTEAMEQLLGLTYEQFTQVAMIAQGGFMELLRASSLDRRRIFRQLFSTELYEQLQDHIRKDADEAAARLLSAQESIRRCINQTAVLPEDEEAFAAYKTADAPDTASYLAWLDQLMQREREQHETYSAELRRCREKKLAAAFDEQRGKNQLQRRQEMAKLDAELAELTSLLLQAEEKVQHAQSRRPEAEAFRQKSYALQQQLETYERRDQQLRLRAELDKQLQAMLQKVERTNKMLLENAAMLQEDERTLEGLVNAPEAAADARQAADKAAEKLRLAHELKQEQADIVRQQENLKQLHLNCEVSLRYHNMKREAWKRLDNAYYAHLVGNLALELSESTPCPVCGSVVHPRPAPVPDGQHVTRTEVDEAKADMEASGKTAEQDRLLREKCAAELLHRQSDLRKRMMTLYADAAEEDPTDVLPSLCKRAELAHAAALNLLQRAQEQLNALEHARQMRTAHQKMEVSFRERVQQEQQQAADLQGRLLAAEAAAVSLSEGLYHPNREAAEAEINMFSRLAQETEAAIRQTQAELETHQKRHALLLGRKATLEEQQAADAPVQLEEVRCLLDTLTVQENALEAACEHLSARRRNHQAIRQQMPELCSNYEAADKKCRWLGKLHATFNGKLSLEAWVQTAYFDRILYQANLRLRSMTGGQYELLRRQEELNARQSAGLNLDVIDHLSGTIRSVTSLSGGESFKAALSLALGLSDEIRASSGGVKLEAMFVDEGFGSLDDYSLRQALSALTGVSNAGCLVGIISHVDELKHRIDRQIVVTKNSEQGSRARII